jgi:Lrp/AsnC family leucine-responsive transcriptional regulator
MPKKSKIIDEKDRKILEELDNNARQTDSQIAKKVGLSKQVVNYRIQNMIKNNLIMNFYTLINTGYFGLDSFYVFLDLEYINKEQEKKLLEKINSLDFVGWLVSGTGKWDVVLLINASSISVFESYLDKVKLICGKHLHTCTFTALINSQHIGYRLIGDRPYLSAIKREEKRDKIELSKQDILILKIISQNSRMPITEIAQKTKLPVHVVNYRLKSMIKNKIILGFKPQLNISKLGYQWHLLLLKLKIVEDKRKEEFLEFCKSHKDIYYITNTIGDYSIMIDIHVQNINEYRETLLDIKDKFSDLIRDYESIIVFEEYKISYLPSM